MYYKLWEIWEVSVLVRAIDSGNYLNLFKMKGFWPKGPHRVSWNLMYKVKDERIITFSLILKASLDTRL